MSPLLDLISSRFLLFVRACCACSFSRQELVKLLGFKDTLFYYSFEPSRRLRMIVLGECVST